MRKLFKNRSCGNFSFWLFKQRCFLFKGDVCSKVQKWCFWPSVGCEVPGSWGATGWPAGAPGQSGGAAGAALLALD